MTGSEWADTYRFLSPESSPEPGKWRTSRAPYLKGIMDACADPFIEEVCVKGSAQFGKSECINNAAGYFIHLDPGPIMILQPRVEDAEKYSKVRLATMIRDTPVLKSRIAALRAKDGSNTILEKSFPGGRLRLSGANSPASLASDPIRILLSDEADRYEETSEGDPLELAIKRTNNFLNRKIIVMSTPAEEKTSRIEKRWKESDRRFFYMPCPHCHEMIRFIWRSEDGKQYFIWDKDNPESVVYICPECDAVIEEKEKPKMLAQGKWIATAPFKGVAGFHIWEAYSPWRRWSQIAAYFLRTKDYPESLKVFVNTSLGECWKQKDGDVPEWERLYERRETYSRDTVPDGVYFLTCGVDVQEDRLEAEVIGWGKNLESWSICHRVFPRSTKRDDTAFEELDKMLAEQWPTSNGGSLPIRMLAIDSSYDTQRVYSWVRRYPQNRVVAVKGFKNLQSIVEVPKTVDVNSRGGKLRRGLRVWRVGTDTTKSEIMGFLRLKKPLDGEPFPPGYCHFPEYDDEYFKQLTAEHVELQRNKHGYDQYVWVKHYERNEVLDLRVYNRAAAFILGIDRMKDSDWERLKLTKVKTIASVLEKSPDEGVVRRRRRTSNWL